MVKIHNFDSFSIINESINREENIIIGDSCTPFIAKNTKYAKILSSKGSEEALWKGGMGIKWLIGALDKYSPTTSIKNVIINIGTNGGFNINSNISGLFSSLRRAFPSANFIAVQGSWGWGGNKSITASQVKAFYQKFAKEGAVIIEPPIGSVSDPHGNLPVYGEIGKSIDNILENSKGSGVSNINNVTKGTNGTTVTSPGVYTTSSSDPYQYKVINGIWYTKGKTILDWKSLVNNKKANDILDNQFPDARTKEAKEANNKLY
jgi:hypothetical protein